MLHGRVFVMRPSAVFHAKAGNTVGVEILVCIADQRL